MPKGNTTWNVLPHQPLEKLSENLWRIEGSLPSMPLMRVMAIAKRGDGDLVIHNAIALEEELMAEIDSWGKVRYILVPNGWHRLDAQPYRDRYPDAKILCPSGARKKVEEVTKLDGTYEAYVPDRAAALTMVDGIGKLEGLLTVKSQDGVSLVFNDILFNMPHLPGLQGFILRHVTKSSGGLHVSRIGSLFMVKDKAALRSYFEKLAEIPDLRRILVAHHKTVTEDPAGALRAAAAKL